MIHWTEGARVVAGLRTWIATLSVGFWYSEAPGRTWWIEESAVDGTFSVHCAVKGGRPSRRFRSFVGAAMYARFGDAIPSGVA